MTKAKLNLSIDTELLEVAKAKQINLSQAFEEYVRAILQIDNESLTNNPINPDIEMQKHLAEIERLKLSKEKQSYLKDQEQMEEMFWETIIKSYNEELNLNLSDKNNLIERYTGKTIPFLFKKKLNKNITQVEAKEELLKRLNG